MNGRPHVVVRVERSGGFAGIARDWTVDTAELTAEQAGVLRDLVTAALAAVEQSAAAADAVGESLTDGQDVVRDGFAYLVVAQVGGRRHRWQGPTAAVPAVRQLAEHVRQVAFDA